ncbi:MAG: hypothetical protein ACJAYW_001934 [Candidatus Azotimanducaceae bacterium]|jgi:hypothetical protein
MVSIPAFAEDFTTDWLNGALAPHLGTNSVVSCQARDSDIPGQTAEIVLLEVGYEVPDANLPDRMVAKITSRSTLILEHLIANYDQYRRETSFYREFPDSGIPVPKCLYSDHDPVKQEMVILMADLAPSISPSWAISPDQVRMALANLPGFHAKWWNDPRLRQKDWIVQFDNLPFFEAAAGAANAAAGALDKLYDTPDLTKEVMSYFSCNQDPVQKFFASRPFTFVHGDYHAKQMFFPTQQGGEFAVIDWQFPFVAQGAWDFARMLGMCMPADLRRSEEQALLGEYLSGLASQGVEGYSRNDLEVDYRMGLIVSQMIMCIAAADSDPAIFEKECGALGLDWKEVTFNRTQYVMEEWDVLGFLKSL